LAQDTLDRVRQNIRERLEEIEGERDQLLRALEALTSDPSPMRRRGRPPGTGATSAAPAGGAPRKRSGGRRAARGQRREQVLAVLEGRELGPSGIAREIGDVNPTQISGLLRQLAANGEVTRTEGGQWRLASVGSGAPAPAGGTQPAEPVPAPTPPPFESYS
jgi:hypothetical protein